jgi:N-methylhydantoinase B
MTTTIDPITSRVIGGALEQAAIEMGYKLSRMSYSSIIRESEDFGASLLDADGTLLCESKQSTPLQLGPIPGYLRGIREIFGERGEDFAEGDVIIHNSAYHGASHGPDIGICIPVYMDGDLIGFSFITAHVLDIGGNAPGTCLIDSVDAYAEGLQLKALKIVDQGRTNDVLWRLLRDNLRASDLVVGDIEAMVAACRSGAARFVELVEEYGLDMVKAASQDAIAHSEKMLRAEIEKLPDGEYTAERFLDGFQDHEDPSYKNLRIAVAVRIEGSDITVDLTGSARQLDDLPVNMPFHGTLDVAVWLTIRSILLDTAVFDDVPQNEGMLRPIKIVAPKGTIANPIYPAPTIARCCAGQIVADTIMQALAQVVPEQVSAGVGSIKVVNFVGLSEGTHWVHMDIHEAAYGGRYGMDGMDAVDCLFVNTRNAPIEDIESHYPLTVNRYELAEDRAGAGRWRGGLGVIRDVTLHQDGRINVEGEGNVFGPPPLFGGTPGTPGELIRNPGREDETALHSKVLSHRVAAGTTLRSVSPCGGGYGDPLTRPVEDVRDDVLDGIVSAESAKRLYGVVVDAATGEVDTAATESLRGRAAQVSAPGA